MTHTTIQQNIKELLAKSEQTELNNPQQSYVYAEEARGLAQQHKLYYEQCLALLHLAGVKESLAESTNQTENLLKKAIVLAEEHEFAELLIQALSKMSSLLANTNQLENAIECIERAKQYLKALKVPNEKLELTVLYDDISIRHRKGEAGSSFLTDCLKGVEKAIALNNEGLHTGFLQMLTMLSVKMGDIEAGIKYSKQFIELEERRNFHMSLVGGYLYQSSLYEKLGQLAEAEKAFANAAASSKKLGDNRSYILVEIRRIYFYLTNERMDEAHNLCNHLLTLPEINEMPKVRFEVIAALAQVAAAGSKINDAIQLYQTEYNNFQQDKIILQKITKALHELYAKAGNYQLAYTALLENKTITQEIYDTQKTKEYTELHARFETKEKEVQLRETRLQKLDAELKAIKSQMNPHFAFNTLKTIDQQMELGNTQSARQSLNAFAQLMRATLHQSGNEFTLIEDEVLLLNNYIQLEQNAIGDSFAYTIKVDEAIDQSYERVPSIFLQPIVENAIKHGLRHKQGNKHLSIGFSLNNDELIVTIEDNGIGRKASAALNKFRINHQSFAGDAMQKRIQYLNEKAGYAKYEFAIEDLEQGTKATLLVKQSES